MGFSEQGELLTNTMELHFPGTNYMGPGTDIKGRISRGVRPTTHIDEIAMKHDLDYSTSREPILSDIDAIIATKVAHNPIEIIQAMVMRYGLTIRSVYDLLFHILPIENPLHINKVISDVDELRNKSKTLKPYQ